VVYVDVRIQKFELALAAFCAGLATNDDLAFDVITDRQDGFGLYPRADGVRIADQVVTGIAAEDGWTLRKSS
jgi:hypothetical protein